MRSFRALLAATTLIAGAQGAAAATFGQDDYRFVIIESFSREDLASHASAPTINDDGTVLYYDRNRITGTGVPEYVTVDIDGVETSRILPVEGWFVIGGVINDNGQIVAEIADANSATADRSLVLIDPDGNVTELMRISSTGTPGAAIAQLVDVRVNASGEVAFSGRNLAGRDVIGKVAPGLAPVFLDEDIPGVVGGRNVVNTVDITDDGLVVWFAGDSGEPPEILASDGTSPPQVILFSDGPARVSTQFATNNVGQVIGTVNNFGPSVVLGDGFDETGYDPEAFSEVFSLTGSFFPFVQGLDINDFGQVLVRNGDDGSIYLDGERLIGAGDLLGIGELIPLARGGEPTRIVSGAALNNLGQLVFEAASSRRGTQPGTLAGTETIVVRADPRGATPDHAVLPMNTVNGVNAISLNLINDLGVAAPIFVDPVLGSGLLYELAAGMPNFMSLIIPDQDLGGDDMFDVSFNDMVVSLGFDEVLDFASYVTGGVSRFRILGIGPEVGEATDDPFVVGLTFASRGRVDFAITELALEEPSPIPLPAAGFLLLGGLLGLGMLRRGNRRPASA
jgi:hypothetical protein